MDRHLRIWQPRLSSQIAWPLVAWLAARQGMRAHFELGLFEDTATASRDSRRQFPMVRTKACVQRGVVGKDV